MSFRKKYLHRDNRFIILFFSLLALVVIPALSLLISLDLTELIYAICFSGIVVAGFVWTSAESKKQRMIGTPLGVIAFISLWARTGISLNDKGLYLFYTIAALAFFNFLAFTLLSTIVRSREVNVGIIFGSIAGYLTIGILGGLWMNLLDLIQPYSFNANEAQLHNYDYFYFSFVAMTTLGFGDILPQNPPAKSVVILLTLIGQLYLTILVALLVGKFLAKNGKAES
jgi:hypothetical protein